MLIITTRLPPQRLGFPRLTGRENLLTILCSCFCDYVQQTLKTGKLARSLQTLHLGCKFGWAHLLFAHSPLLSNAALNSSSADSDGTVISQQTTLARLGLAEMWDDSSAASDSLFALS